MPPKSCDDDEEKMAVAETDALLLRPSANSTTQPSLTNLVEYGSLFAPAGEDADQALIQMSASSEGLRSLGDDAWPYQRRYTKKRGLLNRLIGVAPWLLLLLAGIVGGVFWHQEKRSSDVEETKPSSSNSIHQQHGYISRVLPPLSHKHPVVDLKVKSFQRPTFSAPNADLFPSSKQALPTNSWYQNLLLAHDEPTQEQRVYPNPYMIDVVGPIPGIRVHHPDLLGGANVIQLTQVLEHGLTLGVASRQSIASGTQLSKKYKIAKMTKLGITLEWTKPTLEKNTTNPIPPITYSSSIVKGMPYATVQYNSNEQRRLLATDPEEEELLPTIASETPIGAPPLLDGDAKLSCENDSEPQWVQNEIQLVFAEPDYTWLVFVSRPVRVKCMVAPPGKEAPVYVPGRPMPSPGVVFALQFLDDDDSATSDLVVRAALANVCTFGGNQPTCGQPLTLKEKMDPAAYADLLRKHADLYPGPDTDVTFDFVDGTDDAPGSARVNFNWNVQSMSRGQGVVQKGGLADKQNGVQDERNLDSDQNDAGLLMYALPHHQDLLEGSEIKNEVFPTYSAKSHNGSEEARKFCKESLLGPVCLVEGSTWSLKEQDSLSASFRAPRPPQSSALPALVSAYKKDLKYELPSYFQRGAGDTYFSGKMLAKLGRILTIGEELHEICTKHGSNTIPKECSGLSIPGPEDQLFLDALVRLRSSVEVWINGTADTPFIYDDAWGGMVSCGCDFNDKKGGCRNEYPDCPAFYDPGMDFGLSWFNDHHFHLGYHIYAAAVVAHFDPQWGRDHFEQVVLLIRDIANPSHDDVFFPTFRNKDWYQGSSWASGIAVSPLNGRNQESSSEAIAAYEGIALFGNEMLRAWTGHDKNNVKIAKEIQNYGGILMASEVRSADRYWHVYESNRGPQYPPEYAPHVVGIMWNMMAQFQTWFGSAAYLAYGIQLLPLTAVAEKRDKIDWSLELYEPFKASCDDHFQDCQDQGWSVLVLAVLATVGHGDKAIEKALELPEEVFTSAGGNGHSLTNTLWYLATRPHLDSPLVLEGEVDEPQDQTEAVKAQSDVDDDDIDGLPSEAQTIVLDPFFACGCPDTCNDEALGRYADGHSCRDRIIWLMTEQDHTERDACHQVGLEFPSRCASCDPLECSAKEVVSEESEACPPCPKEVCSGPLNLCPLHSAPYLCTEGGSIGGCSRFPWLLTDGICEGCCKLSKGCQAD